MTDQTVVTASAASPSARVEADRDSSTLCDAAVAARQLRLDSATDIGTGGSSTNNATQVFLNQPTEIGRYRLCRHVGSGAMGDVYEAHDPQLDRRVAVKVPRCERLARNRNLFTERFVREARAAAAVRHAHICPIYDAGDHHGQPYVVMAFVEGETLDNLLSRQRIEFRRAVEITIQVADALAAIHQHGIIHRDLKPGNILMDEAGQALLTDFGLALSEISGERLTSDGLIVGTPVYMSPEQAAGENSTLTPAADLYSLGAVLYEMLTGQAPFRGPLPELLRKIMLQTPAPATEARPELDPQLSGIVDKLLSKSPVDRYPSAAALVEALRLWLGSTASGDAIRLSGASAHAGKAWRSHRTARLLAGVALFVAIGFAAFQGWVSRGHDGRKSLGATSSARDSTSTPVVNAHLVDLASQSAASRPLTGNLTITISSDPQKGAVAKSRISASEPGALPVRTGELVRFEVQLNQPAYVYLLWVNPDGSVSPLFPWDAEHFATEGWDAPVVAGSDKPSDHIITPANSSRGFETVPPEGLQTVVLLARHQPLDGRIRLAQLLSGLPATPQLAMAEVRGPILRGVKTGQTVSTQDAQFDELEERLSPHFDLMRVLSFPQIEGPQPRGVGDGSPLSQQASNRREDPTSPAVVDSRAEVQ